MILNSMSYMRRLIFSFFVWGDGGAYREEISEADLPLSLMALLLMKEKNVKAFALK